TSSSSSCSSSRATSSLRAARRSTKSRKPRPVRKVMAMALGKLPDQDADEEGNESIYAEINITPLTDVFLVLVIIFMVSELAVQVEARQEKKKTAQAQEQSEVEKRSGLKVNLPSGQAQEIDTKGQSLVLTVPLQGDVDVGGKRIPDAELDNL